MTSGEMSAALSLLEMYVPSLFNGCQTIDSVNQLKANLLGRESILMDVMKGMRDVPSEARAEIGVFVNSVKNLIDLHSNNALTRLGSGYYQ